MLTPYLLGIKKSMLEFLMVSVKGEVLCCDFWIEKIKRDVVENQLYGSLILILYALGKCNDTAPELIVDSNGPQD